MKPKAWWIALPLVSDQPCLTFSTRSIACARMALRPPLSRLCVFCLATHCLVRTYDARASAWPYAHPTPSPVECAIACVNCTWARVYVTCPTSLVCVTYPRCALCHANVLLACRVSSRMPRHSRHVSWLNSCQPWLCSSSTRHGPPTMSYALRFKGLTTVLSSNLRVKIGWKSTLYNSDDPQRPSVPCGN